MALYSTKLDEEEALLIKTIIESNNFSGKIVENIAAIKLKMIKIIASHEKKTGDVVSNEQPEGFERVK